MADDTSEDMNMAAFVGSYLGNNKSATSSQEPEGPAESDTLFCTPNREEEAEVNRPFNLDDVQRSNPVSIKRNIGSASRPLTNNSETALKRPKNSVSENERALEEEAAVPSIERDEIPVSRAGMAPPPKPAANASDTDAQTEFLRSLISRSSNVQKVSRGKLDPQHVSVTSQSTSAFSNQGPVQVKREPQGDPTLTAIPEHVRPPSSAGSKRSLSIIAMDRTPPAKRLRLQELVQRKTGLKNQAEEMRIQIETERKAHEDRIAQFEADKKAYEAACAEQEAEFRQQEERELGEIQALKDMNIKLDQKLQRQRAVQQEQLAFWREERQQLGISIEDAESSVAEDDGEGTADDRNPNFSKTYQDGQDWP